MKIKETPGERIFDIVNIILLLALVFVIVMPVWHVVCYSFSDANRVMATNGLLLLHAFKFKLFCPQPVFLSFVPLKSIIIILKITHNFKL